LGRGVPPHGLCGGSGPRKSENATNVTHLQASANWRDAHRKLA
jgi:hypothetical protein